MELVEVAGSRLTPEQSAGVWALLVAADREFIPPLSHRESTTQTDLSDSGGAAQALPYSYFDILKTQRFILAMQGTEVRGFMSYRPKYRLRLPDGRVIVSDYVSTVIVDPAMRGRHLTERFYKALFRTGRAGRVMTRTWSTNEAHLTILRRLGFQNTATLPDDRAPGVDTVYYDITLEGRRLSFWKKLRAYHLSHQALAVLLLIVLMLASVAAYCLPAVHSAGIAAEILLAIFTSLMASIVAVFVELYVSYRNAERDAIIEDIHAFGIEKMNENKEDALREMLQTCEDEVWISGYRLIMTKRLRYDIAEAVEAHGVNVRMLVCPPWSQAYELVYDRDPVMKNYAAVLRTLWEARAEYLSRPHSDPARAKLEVRLTRHPIFSDTYRVDSTFVTGPYMHNQDENGNMLTAKDFFSYNIVRKSRLYHYVENEFETLWNDPTNLFLPGDRIGQLLSSIREDSTDTELLTLFQDAAAPVTAREA